MIAKALLVAGLAALMLAIYRPASGRAAPAACTALALVAMSPRLLLQPACVSFFLLGLVLWLLWRPHADASRGGDKETRRGGEGEIGTASVSPSPPLPLSLSSSLPLSPSFICLVFVLWVNLDSWFFLGPLLAGLFWLGERLGGVRRTPGWLAPAGLGLCLLNPHHFHAFILPAKFAPWLSPGLAGDVRFQRLFISPWQVGIHLQPAAVNLAEWAYFLLVLLGIVSFALHREALRSWRLTVWLGFALLGAWQVRTVPFFAVVAGPIAALNLQDFLGRYQFSVAAGRAVRGGLLAAGWVLVALCWLGGLHGFSGDGRRVGWAAQADPSLERVCQTLKQWRREHRLDPGARVFNFHPDLAHCWAWSCEEEKSFFDFRLPLFSDKAAEYESVCRALNPALHSGPPPAGDWRKPLRDYRVSHLVLYDPDPGTLMDTLSRMDRNSDWTIQRIDGKAVLFAWKEASGPLPDYRAHADRLAFSPRGPEDEEEMPPAPGRGPGRGPRERTARQRLTSACEPEAPASWEAAAAAAFLRVHDDGAAVQQRDALPRALAAFAALAAEPAQPSGLAGVLARGASLQGALADDEPSPALLLLAVRAARRALAVNPDEAFTWLHLGQAYFSLGREAVLPPLATLRHIQLVTALENALVRNPDLAPAHETLAVLFVQSQCLDSALEHARAGLALGRRNGPLPGENADGFARRMDRTERRLRDLQRRVQDLQNQFAVRSLEVADNPPAKARLAVSLGLPRQALQVLEQSQDLLFGAEALRLQLELLLTLGQAEAARQILDDEDVRKNRDKLGFVNLPAPPPLTAYRFPAYDWLASCQAAAAGDYDRAAEHLGEIRTRLEKEARENVDRVRWGLPLALAWELGMRAQPPALPAAACRERLMMTGLLKGTQLLRQESADLAVVAGLLALERGQPGSAQRSCARPSGRLAWLLPAGRSR